MPPIPPRPTTPRLLKPSIADKAKKTNEADKAKANEADAKAINPTIHQS
jgi:hypothetical protein